MGDGWAGKEGCVTSRKDVHPARGSERKRIERQRMSIEVAGRHRQCATRTHEDGILRRHCKRCAVAVGTVLVYPPAVTRHRSLKVLVQRHLVDHTELSDQRQFSPVPFGKCRRKPAMRGGVKDVLIPVPIRCA